MIIQLRGTSGSGKTWAMREIMKKLPGTLQRSPVYREGRKNPEYYWIQHGESGYAVLGSYESTCGGCDNIGSAREVYELIDRVYSQHGRVEFDENGNEVLSLPTVLCEGLLLSEDVKWTSQVKDDIRIIFLTTPLQKCLDQVRSRRKEAGNTKELNVENTSKRVATIERARQKLMAAGKSCVRLSANQVPSYVLKLILGANGG